MASVGSYNAVEMENEIRTPHFLESGEMIPLPWIHLPDDERRAAEESMEAAEALLRKDGFDLADLQCVRYAWRYPPVRSEAQIKALRTDSRDLEEELSHWNWILDEADLSDNEHIHIEALRKPRQARYELVRLLEKAARSTNDRILGKLKPGKRTRLAPPARKIWFELESLGYPKLPKGHRGIIFRRCQVIRLLLHGLFPLLHRNPEHPKLASCPVNWDTVRQWVIRPE